MYVTPKSGVESTVGYITDPMFKLEPLNEDTTFGDATVGFDGSIAAKVKATAPGDVSQAIDCREADRIRIIGPLHTATLNNIFISVNVQKGFHNKTGESYIELNAKYPGMTPTVAKTILTATT
jgi:hypothetical protein